MRRMKSRFTSMLVVVAMMMTMFTFVVPVGAANGNLVVNGDFELGNTGFTSEYAYVVAEMYNPQTFGVGLDPKAYHPAWASFGDHTSGSGLMMIVNAADVADKVVWQQSVSVVSGTEYDFSMWAGSSYAVNPAKLEVLINDVPQGFNTLTGAVPGWQELAFAWTADDSTAVIKIIDRTVAYNGDDFVIDDISLVAKGGCTAPEPVYDPEFEAGNAASECAQTTCDSPYAYKVDDWNVDKDEKPYFDGNGTYTTPEGAVITISNSDGYKFDWTSTFPVCSVIVKAGTGANIYYTMGAYSGTCFVAPEGKAVSHVTFCFRAPNGGGFDGEISAKKWYDRNKNGVQDEGEPALEGWKINLTGMTSGGQQINKCALTDDKGLVTFKDLDPGTYYLSEEDAPAGSGWVQTFPEGNSYEVVLAEPDDMTKSGYLFGNVCEATAEGGKTLGWWSNKNGAKALAGTEWDDFVAEYGIIDKDGAADDFETYNAFRAWLLGANAQNMTQMLQVQMVVTNLNIDVGDADYTGYGVIGWDAEFISIVDLLAEAAQFVADNPDTTAAGPARDQAEFYKNIFDGLNNNAIKIIKYDPCLVPMFTCD
ncbi:MAG: hypothetical protein K0B85_06445 [Coriobacteriia bacterium]|nr:hypothetical protein [Coriobacteriia bacterium]